MLDSFKVSIKANRNMYKYTHTHTLAVKVSQSDNISHLMCQNMTLFLKPPQSKPNTLTNTPTSAALHTCQFANILISLLGSLCIIITVSVPT